MRYCIIALQGAGAYNRSMHITKDDVSKLARLARIALSDDEKQVLVKGLEGILGHFEDLQKVDVEGVVPVSGGTLAENVAREDSDEVSCGASRDDLFDVFPNKAGEFLKVPPVFG